MPQLRQDFFKVLVVSSYDPILDMAREKGLTAKKITIPVWDKASPWF